MKKVLLTMLVILTLSNVALLAEEYNRSFGFTGGHISGIGYAYRQYFDNNGMQFTFGMISNRDKAPLFPESKWFNSSTGVNTTYTKKGWEVDGWISAMYIRTLRKSELTRFYFFVGGSMKIDYTKRYTQSYVKSSPSSYYYDKVGSPVEKKHNDNNFYVGPGIGLEHRINKYISFLIELPISFSSNKKIETYTPQAGILIKF